MKLFQPLGLKGEEEKAVLLEPGGNQSHERDLIL